MSVSNSQPSNQLGQMQRRPDPVTARIAPYTGRTGLVLVFGGLLIGVNTLGSYEGHAILHGLAPAWPGPASGQEQLTLLDVVAQLVMLAVLFIIAGVSEEGGNFAVIFLAALWLGWLFVNRAWVTGVVGLLSGAGWTPGTGPGTSSGGSSKTGSAGK